LQRNAFLTIRGEYDVRTFTKKGKANDLILPYGRLPKNVLPQAQYCRVHDFKTSNFYNWSLKYRDHKVEDSSPAHDQAQTNPDFILLTIRTVQHEFKITYKDISLQFSSGLTPESLVPWIKALRTGAC